MKTFTRRWREGLSVAVVIGSFATHINAAPTNSNIALNTTTIVSSSYSSTTYGNKAVDGNYGTYWRTKFRSNLSSEYILVDLGNTRSISRVVLNWNIYFATRYDIEISTDNVSWTKIFAASAENGAADTIDFSAMNARYVRMTSFDWNNSKQRIWLNELQVYADDGVVPPPPVSGAWTVVPSTNLAGSSLLRSVSAVNANDVWAVGQGAGSDWIDRTMIQHWNGNAWTTVSSPNPSANGDVLNGVSAAASTDVWAVGTANTRASNFERALTLHWDGGSWYEVAPPDVVGQAERLNAVSALSSSLAWSVGSSPSALPRSGLPLPLISFWNGNYWSNMPIPVEFNTSFGELNGITAISENDVWAAGYIYHDTTGQRPLVMHWNGIAWSIAPLPNTASGCCFVGNSGYRLSSLSANAANDIWAVGELGGKNLTMHYNGSSWSVVNSPNDLQKQQNYLTGVAALSTNDVWAVGVSFSSSINSAGTPTSTEVTTIMHWNGSAWSLVASPDPSIYHNLLYGITKINSSDVWSVGNTADFYNSARTMIQHYTAQ